MGNEKDKKLKYSAIFPAVCAFVALVISFLCVFAGSKPGYLESYDIITLNTSRIAVDVFDPSNPSKGSGKHHDSDGLLGDIVHGVTHDVHHFTNQVEGEIEDTVNDVLASFAKVIGLHDFYSVHVLDFCNGYYSPNGTSNKKVTHCSNTQGFFTFSPSKTLQRELNASGLDVSLSDLHWPTAIDEAVDSLKLAFDVMFALFCLGIAATGLAFWGAVAGVFFHNYVVELVNIFLTQLAFFSLMISAAIVTGAADKAEEVINEYGKEIDVNATKGIKLIALSWTAVLLMLVVSMFWAFQLVWRVRQGKRGKVPKQDDQENYSKEHDYSSPGHGIPPNRGPPSFVSSRRA